LGAFSMSAERESTRSAYAPCLSARLLLTLAAMITSWRDISELTKADVALLEGDERARFTPEMLLWTARELARYRLWEQAN
jgi:hypothetical protein